MEEQTKPGEEQETTKEPTPTALEMARLLKEKEDLLNKREAEFEKKRKDFEEFVDITIKSGRSQMQRIETEEERIKRETNKWLEPTGYQI